MSHTMDLLKYSVISEICGFMCFRISWQSWWKYRCLESAKWHLKSLGCGMREGRSIFLSSPQADFDTQWSFIITDPSFFLRPIVIVKWERMRTKYYYLAVVYPKDAKPSVNAVESRAVQMTNDFQHRGANFNIHRKEYINTRERNPMHFYVAGCVCVFARMCVKAMF